MDKQIFENINQRTLEQKNKHYNDAYRMAYEEMEEIILEFISMDTNENAANQILGYVKGKLDMVSQYKIDFMNLKTKGEI